MSSRFEKASLVVVGSGIKFISHLTMEAKIHIEKADKVLYLVNDPAMQEWIERSNSNAESLDPLYREHPLRLHNYRKITNYILETLRKNLCVCVVLYGHPTVFAQPALDAVIRAQKEGFYARVLPGISAVDCLFADLLIDFGMRGCQLIEATDLLVYRRKPDTSSHLILWQVGVIGMLSHSQVHDNSKAVTILCEYLKDFYSNHHQINAYEAAQYPGLEPKMMTFPLCELAQIPLSRISTLYIPPACKNNLDISMLNQLGIDIKNLT